MQKHQRDLAKCTIEADRTPENSERQNYDENDQRHLGIISHAAKKQAQKIIAQISKESEYVPAI